jgi:hypothetical protein
VVLLVGGDTYDYKDLLGYGAQSYLPSIYGSISSKETYFPLDGKYVDIDNDDVPDLAMGRLPVRTVGELTTLLQKRTQYINRSYRNSALFIADSEHTGAYNFKAAADAAIASDFDEWNVATAYLDDLDVWDAKSSIINAINAGTSLVSYYGHSSTNSWSVAGVLNTRDTALLNSATPTVITQWGCWNTYYVEPSADTMAQSYLLDGSGGAVSVAGAASQTSGSSEHTFAGYFNELVMGDENLSLGEAILQAKQTLASSQVGNLDIILAWGLLGFPELSFQ